ncbi:MAG TPA: fumarylacetoacetate hydrolase family protein [Vicinamibacterales bacterium]|jgi:2-keto-4-pentenoate hydratase/2-oxohepta-3-ene-1,7-dioic acid hydratase in catechol pathway|nr:fumarylacetoacetate hydrolase family protein [Vicinamibacterales bacterium]
MRWLNLHIGDRQLLGTVAADDSVVFIDDACRSAGVSVPVDTPDLVRAWLHDSDRLRRIVASVSPASWRQRSDVKLASAVQRPGKLLCLAGNYREHIVESGFAPVAVEDVITPQMFLKPSTCLIGDNAEVRLSPENVRVGWEVELAVVIGRSASRVSVASAMDHVFGYTILNDLSERGLNSRLPGRRLRERDPFFDWLAGKWFDGFAPCGPWIVTADEIPDPHALELRLTVNGELRQRGTTADMIFDIPTLIASASAIMTLEPGDIIATGTPAGAGIGTSESVLRPGDQVVCEIDAIGALHTTIGEAA